LLASALAPMEGHVFSNEIPPGAPLQPVRLPVRHRARFTGRDNNSVWPRSPARQQPLQWLILIFIGVLLMMHNYRGFELGHVLGMVAAAADFFGGLKLYERMAVRGRMILGVAHHARGSISGAGVAGACRSRSRRRSVKEHFPDWVSATPLR